MTDPTPLHLRISRAGVAMDGIHHFKQRFPTVDESLIAAICAAINLLSKLALDHTEKGGLTQVILECEKGNIVITEKEGTIDCSFVAEIVENKP
jgi:predicted regulator of Ras-like GTPase activity (Roadblock/LC7/MglB family)